MPEDAWLVPVDARPVSEDAWSVSEDAWSVALKMVPKMSSETELHPCNITTNILKDPEHNRKLLLHCAGTFVKYVFYTLTKSELQHC